MADFDNDWKITGTPDPATPDPQPHQTQAQPQMPVYNTQPVQQATVPGFVPAPVQQAQPQMPVYNTQPAQQTVPGFAPPPVQQAQPQQPAAQPVVIGYNVNGPVYRNNNGFVTSAPRVDHTAEREVNLAEVQKMINYFSPKLDVFKDYEACQQEIVKFSKTSVAPFVWGILLILHGFVSAYIAFTSKAKNNIMIYAIAAAAFAVFGAGFMALYFWKKKRHEKKVKALLEKFEDLSGQLKILYNGYSGCILPSEYIDPRLLGQFQSMIYQGRAFSIGSALNSMLALPGVYQRIMNAKRQFDLETAAQFNGTAAFFNAFRYFPH